MKKIVRNMVVATNLVTIGFAVMAQSTLPRSTTTGPSSCGTYCGSYDNYSGEGEGGEPEADSAGSTNITTAPSPKTTKTKKTPAQKKAAVDECEKKRLEERAKFTTIYTSTMAICAAGTSSWYGYLQEQWKQVGAPLIVNGHPQDCGSVATRTYEGSLEMVDKRGEICVIQANAD